MNEPARRPHRRLTWVALTIWFVPAVAAGQVLDTVESLSRDGQTAEARETLAGWWQDEAQGASRADVQRALWLRATLTLDPELATRDYRRLTVEYPAGPYSDRALARIAQASAARGAFLEAAGAWQTLVRDHPASPLLAEARSWLERNRDAVEAERARERASQASAGPPDRRSPPSAREAPPAPPGRPDVPAATARSPEAPAAPVPEAPTVVAPAAEPPAPEPAPEAGAEARVEARVETSAAAEVGSGDFAVQLGAFSTTGRAGALVETLRARGLEPRLVTIDGDALVRVRVGRFRDAGDAMDLRAHVRGMGLEAIIVQDASRERPAR